MSLIGIGTAIGNAIAPWLGEWVTVAIAGSIVKGIRNQFDPNEMKRVLKNATAAAEAAQPETGGLFFRCQKGGRNGVTKFLGEFFQSGEVLKELQKPLEECGKPDVDILVAAFTQLAQSAQQHSEVKNYLPTSLHPWMEKFVESYFEQIKGICFQVAKAQYLKQLARRVDDVKFVGIAVPGEEVEKQEVLAQIFVMPDVREERSKGMTHDIDYGCAIDSAPDDLPAEEYQRLVSYVRQKDLQQEQRAWAMRDRSTPRIPAQKVINLAQKKAVVLGAPGSGKTMLASYFALMLCETAQSDPTQIGLEKDADYLPVMVRIRDWILQPNMGLLEYLRSNAEASLACKELPTGFFEHWLERGRALILLDGLDEVVDEAQRRKVAEQIETFLHQYQDNPAVITSRPAGYRWDFFDLDEFPHYTLESFDDKQVATFIEHWYDSRLKDDKAQADRRKADLQKAFARNERIRLLAKNPLLLTIITLIHRYQAELPRQRYKLYEKAVETLLTSWHSGKEIKLYSQVLLFLKSDDLLYILKKLAYWIHTQGSTGETEGGTLIDKDELIQKLGEDIKTLTSCKPHEAKGEAKRFVDFIQKRTGLLNKQGRDRYAFVHKTFQEYLTAEEIYDIDASGEDTEIIWRHFREHLHDQHWREVLLLLVSKLTGKKAQKAIQTVLDGNSKYEQWLHRDLLFAGWCLTEDPYRLKPVAPDLVGDILGRLVGLEVENPDRIGSKIRGEVGNILRCFGETTVEKIVWEKLQAQGDRIDLFRLLGFQLALGQEVEAIDILLSLLVDKDRNLRASAASALGQIGNATPVVVNGLLSMLDENYMHVRASVVLSLVKLGSTTPLVISALLSLLKNRVPSGHSFFPSFRELRNTSAAPAVVSESLSLLDDKDSKMRANAALALGELGNATPAVVSGLLSLLDDKDSNMRGNAALALGELGNVTPAVVNGLLSLLDDKDSNVRLNAISSLIKLKNSDPVVISSLLSLLVDKYVSYQISAASLLGELGNSTPEVVNGLLALLDNEESGVRLIAASSMVQLENATPAVVSNLLFGLRDKASQVRFGSASALGQLAKTSDTILPEVVQLLEQNREEDEMGGAIDCLWSIVVE
jgi:HEAT repeat protein